jgi:hypothetical protein
MSLLIGTNLIRMTKIGAFFKNPPRPKNIHRTQEKPKENLDEWVGSFCHLKYARLDYRTTSFHWKGCTPSMQEVEGEVWRRPNTSAFFTVLVEVVRVQTIVR